MTDKQTKEELKQVVKNLCNIEFTVEDELKLYKEALKRKEQECEELRFPMPDTNYAILTKEEFEQLDKLKSENEKLKKECEIYKNQVLTFDDEIITVQITQKQFEEYNKLKTENDTLRQFLSKEPLALQALQSGYASYKKSSDVFYEMVKQYKQTLTEIKDIAEKRNYLDYNECLDDILQKISECEVENEHKRKN